ncbi:MAG: hypothetical protein FD167_5821 [bacterium]|nr:MAG: hypothetical protein FD167_5821 [bacterium]
MTLTKLIPQLKELTHEEMLEAANFLLDQIHKEEEHRIFSGKVPAMVYTPFGMEETALQVMELLKKSE